MYTFTSHSHMKSAFDSGEKCADDDGNKQNTSETLSTVALPRQSEQTHFDIEKTVLKAGLKFFFLLSRFSSCVAPSHSLVRLRFVSPEWTLAVNKHSRAEEEKEETNEPNEYNFGLAAWPAIRWVSMFFFRMAMKTRMSTSRVRRMARCAAWVMRYIHWRHALLVHCKCCTTNIHRQTGRRAGRNS